MFYWNRPFLVGWFFSVLLAKKPFPVDLVDHLFQPASNQFETVEIAIMIKLRDCRVHKDYSQWLPSFDQKWLEKCSIE